MYRIVASVFRAAVLDRVVAVSPCVSIRLPKVDRPKIQPLEVEQVAAVADAVPVRYRALVLLAAGSGLRVSEACGLTVDRVDFLRRTITVDRQLAGRTESGSPVFSPPKTPASNRVVPVGKVVIDALAAHIAEHGASPDGLVFTNPSDQAIVRTYFANVYALAAARAGVVGGFHQLRHHFASTLIGAGCSIMAVQEALGHANASETLDTYSHLWPSDQDRIRDAVDAKWSAPCVPSVSQDTDEVAI